jgi:hypothetical protein
MRVGVFAIVATAAALGCGNSGVSLRTLPGDDSDAGPDAGPESGPDAGSLDLAALAGIWDVHGADARGEYAGSVEIIPGPEPTLLRTIAWMTATVEEGRALHWAFAGTLRQDGPAVTLQATLDSRAFISARGGLVRSLSDPPIVLEGTAALAGDAVRASWSGAAVQQRERWTGRRPSSATPIFGIDYRELPAHDAPSTDLLTASFTAFASFQKLPAVQPYVVRPDFQAAVHQIVLDRTDFAFYRHNPGALRVMGKPIDAITLLETRLRADAFRWPLIEKARGFDRELQDDFLDPLAPIVPDGRAASGAIHPSGDAALWNAAYIASQWYRHQVTGEASAFDNLTRSLEAQLILQEITGTWSQFARSLRRATGAPSGGWHAGGAGFPQLEWLEGGNNDMFKGLFYALTAGFFALCDGRDHALCPRLRENIKHLADDVHIGAGFNDLISTWLAAVALESRLERARYRVKAEARWTAEKLVEKNSSLQYGQGIADWSGTHLAFVGAVTALLLAERLDLGGDAREIFQGQIERSFASVERQRLVLWDLAGAALRPRPAAVEDAVWLLREMPFPKGQARIDHRVNPGFSLSPYPSLPWKNDWTVHDRTQSLRIHPLFELPANVYQWKSQMDFAGDTEGYRNHGVDYLHAYWFGRRLKLLSGEE